MLDGNNYDINKGSSVPAIIKVLLLSVILSVTLGYLAAGGKAQLSDQKSQGFDRRINENAQQMIVQGKQIFRYDTFGDGLIGPTNSNFTRRFKAARLAVSVQVSVRKLRLLSA